LINSYPLDPSLISAGLYSDTFYALTKSCSIFFPKDLGAFFDDFGVVFKGFRFFKGFGFF